MKISPRNNNNNDNNHLGQDQKEKAEASRSREGATMYRQALASHARVIVTYQAYAEAHIGSAAGGGPAWAKSCLVTMELLHNIMETHVRDVLYCYVVLVKKNIHIYNFK